MTTVTLTPEQERFAADAVAQGRYRTVAEVLAAGLSLLQRADSARAAFIASLDAAQAEGERDGFFTIEQVSRELDAVIDAAERRPE